MSEIDVSMCKYYLKDGSCCSMNEDCVKCVHNYCDWKVNQEQLQQLKAENRGLKEKLKEVQKFLEQYEVGECCWKDDCYWCKGEEKDGKYFCSIGNALEAIRGEQ